MHGENSKSLIPKELPERSVTLGMLILCNLYDHLL